MSTDNTRNAARYSDRLDSSKGSFDITAAEIRKNERKLLEKEI